VAVFYTEIELAHRFHEDILLLDKIIPNYFPPQLYKHAELYIQKPEHDSFVFSLSVF